MGGTIEETASGKVRRHLSRVYLQDPSGRHWPVPYADLRQPLIALWEIKAANKRARQEGRRLSSAEAIFTNIQEQRQLVRQAGSLSRQRRRQEMVPAAAATSAILPNHVKTTFAQPK
jgi:hypothetical protein